MADAEGEIPKTCKIVVVGDGTVGKTCLLWVYVRKDFPKKYVPTIFENYSAVVQVNGTEVALNLWDTAGQEEYEKLRILSYGGATVFLLCFAIDNPDSYSNVKDRWYREIRKHNATAAIILVGTKQDLRQGQSDSLTQKHGETLQQEIGAVAYVECSAFQNSGVKAVFDEAIRVSLTYTPPEQKAGTPRSKTKKSLCTVL
eukprot:NODE_3495_length_967_cov_19.340959_g3208_i0.p1 GENE.NODE_3495_length_967_cov_19.340959_g3208_i0~~NODE_3495_length_967_cov_19.340959_g3208_i0.p1  ORF type:complete len:200 (+),score=38.96 NODE_3495_length_967_cov_19.340959_g3208_i0:111-710(+)